jgi:hypothetical protein
MIFSNRSCVWPQYPFPNSSTMTSQNIRGLKSFAYASAATIPRRSIHESLPPSDVTVESLDELYVETTHLDEHPVDEESLDVGLEFLNALQLWSDITLQA